MDAKDFAAACREKRDTLLSSFADLSGGSAVAAHLAAANLTQSQRKQVFAAIDAALTDTFYTLLLALDGSASLAGNQHTFVLIDETGNTIANGDGRLEAAAWAAFHSDS
ncbi:MULTISPECIES: hypothetical protein [unclassified Sphingomonas]|uniref:hypothetical protein n=1 Tax=unclassified Sphingomonas TaxID=196159 RepID=UPI0021509531|nr:MULTISPECIES: hypothetical protein [unclassified Sphingomonas]MCR5871576.1 hypothetical protein [Sphingomonas sp. J344]UUY00128.1 hypothetical protein LRS08_03070 [Sphingomonas sp. J315]